MKESAVSVSGSGEDLNEDLRLMRVLLEKIDIERAVANPVLLGMRQTQRAHDERYYHGESWRPEEKGLYSFDRKSACPLDDHRRRLLRELYYDWDSVTEGPDEILFHVTQELSLVRPLARVEEEAKNYVGPRLDLELVRRIRGKLAAMNVTATFAGFAQDGELVRARMLMPAGCFSEDDIQKYAVTGGPSANPKAKGPFEYSIPLGNLLLFFRERLGGDLPVSKTDAKGR